MAKNYTFAEAVEIINKGTDMEAITDIGRRYPILLHKVSKVAAVAGDSFAELMGYMPEHLTANKVNTAMKNSVDVEEVEDGDEDATESVKPEKTTKAAKAEKASKTKATKSEDSDSDTDYESMSGSQLWDLLGKAGKRKDCKEKMGGAKKDDMIAYIKKYGLGDVAETEDEADVEDVEESSENPYEGISAPELFKECKKRGIKAAAKKPAKYYIDLLVKSDEEVAKKTEATEDEDDWGDEVEEAPKTEKKSSKSSKKATAEKEEAADDDDDWDI